MLFLQQVAYSHPGKDVLFTDIHISLSKSDKIALIGNNGSGKSTLLQLMAGLLTPAAGLVKTDTVPYYVPQLFEQWADRTVAETLRVDHKLNALEQVLAGHVTDENLALLEDDWTIEERCREALSHWGLEQLELSRKMNTLSGGQKTKVFLAGIRIHAPSIVLLDEPSNHLDQASRQLLYTYIRSATHTVIVVSHDRELLRIPDTVYELSHRGLTVYGGNYDFYLEQQSIEKAARVQELKSREKALRKAKETERESIERQQKLDARGRKKQEKAGLPTISMNTFRNNAEKSTSRIKATHAGKVNELLQELEQLRSAQPGIDTMKINLDNPDLHAGKILVTASHINHRYNEQQLWQEPQSFQITSGERIAIKGANGTGKTSLLRMMLGQLAPATGTIERAAVHSMYIDQDYSLIDGMLSVYEQAARFNTGSLQEHEIKIRLNRYLFTKEDWDKKCGSLSGGEKMRLLLCCLTISEQAPGIIVLDEPTNNLDIQNIEILTAAMNMYTGTLLIVSHDQQFLEQVQVNRFIELQ